MGYFDPPERPVQIELLNVKNSSSKAIITYKAIYKDGRSENVRTNVTSVQGRVFSPRG